MFHCCANFCRYKKYLQCCRIVLWCLDEKQFVTSFRLSALSSEYLTLTQKFSSSDSIITTSTANDDQPYIRQKKHVTDDSQVSHDNSNFTLHHDLQLSSNSLRKEQRRKDWEKFLLIKPDRQFEDDDEQASIRNAQQQLGDYKLKTSSDYIVSTKNTVSTDSKRHQLLYCRKLV